MKKDLIGKIYGDLIIINNSKKDKWGGLIVTCRCKCGKIKDILFNSLKRGYTKSCGCQQGKGSRKLINHNAFDILTEETFYWLGFLMADGCVTDKTITIGLANKDRDQLEKFKKFVGGDQTIYTNLKNNSSSFAFRSNKIIKILNNHGIIRQKSLIATPSEICTNNKHFWRGVIDGDGSLILSKNYPIIYLCGSENIIKNFANYSLNIIKHKSFPRKKKNQKIWEINISGKFAKSIIFELYNNSSVFLNRKASLAKNILMKSYINLSLNSCL